jgi:endonuclease YncB( thermonuclease family)
MYLSKRKVIFLTSIFLLILIFNFNQAKAQDIKVVDGDTIHLDGKKIRFSGIDTPESYYRGKRQQCTFEKVKVFCGYWSKLVLIEKIGNNEVTCINEDKPDQYNRVLAECFVNDESLSRYLVRSGFAFAYRKYSKNLYMMKIMQELNKLGMWSMEF